MKFIPDDEQRAELVLQTILGEKICGKKNNLVELHKFPTVSSEVETGVPLTEAPGACTEWDSSHFVKVVDFTSPLNQVTHSIPRRNSLTFLLLSRPMATKKRWDFPNPETAADFINDVLCQMFYDDDPHAEVYDRTGR